MPPFFRSNKKQQPIQQQQQQQRSKPTFQLSLSLSKSRSSTEQSRERGQIPIPSSAPVYPTSSYSPSPYASTASFASGVSPIPSPAHSTISFGAPSPAGSIGAATSNVRSRPSLSLLRPSMQQHAGNDGPSYPPLPTLANNSSGVNAGLGSGNGGNTKPSIYSRFGFNKSSPSVNSSPYSNTLTSQPHSPEGSHSSSTSRVPAWVLPDTRTLPPLPTRTPPPPPKSSFDASSNGISPRRNLSSNPPSNATSPTDETGQIIEVQSRISSSSSLTPSTAKRSSLIPKRASGRPSLSIDGIQASSPTRSSPSRLSPPRAEATSVLLQRRRARSLGQSSQPSPTDDSSSGSGMEPMPSPIVGPKITNLVIPPLVVDQTPLFSTTPTNESTPWSSATLLPSPTASSKAVPSSKGPSILPPLATAPLPSLPPLSTAVPMSARSTTTEFLPPTPVFSTESHRSGSSGWRSATSSLRSRSESNSSRARSESSASTASSSRNGHYSSGYNKRASSRATILRIDDMWAGFLREVEEDFEGLTMAERKNGQVNPETKVSPVDAERKGALLSPLEASETFRNRGEMKAAPLRTRSNSRLRNDAGSDADTVRSLTPTFSTSFSAGGAKGGIFKVRSMGNLSSPTSRDHIGVEVLPSLPKSAVGGFMMESRDSASSLPYLRTPDPNAVLSPETKIKSPQINSTLSPNFLRSPSPAMGLQSPLLEVHSPALSSQAATSTSNSHASIHEATLMPLQHAHPAHITPNLIAQQPSGLFTPRSVSNLSTPPPAFPLSSFSQTRRESLFSLQSYDSRPTSSQSAMSQFSLSMFPSPPSVPVIRATTETGAFKTKSNEGSSDGGHSRGPSPMPSDNGEEVKFKSIVKSTDGKSLVRALFFTKEKQRTSSEKEDMESVGHSSRTTTPTPTTRSDTPSQLSSRSPTPKLYPQSAPATQLTFRAYSPSRLPSLPSEPMLDIHQRSSLQHDPHIADPGPQVDPSPSPNYEALLKSMGTFNGKDDESFGVGIGLMGSNQSRPGTADGKFQWGYAL